MRDKVSDIMNRILEEYPEIWKDSRLFKSVIADLLPGEDMVLLRNLLLFCVAECIPEKIKSSQMLSKINLHRFVVALMKSYGCTEELATKAVLIWAEAIQADVTDISNTEIVLKSSERDELENQIKYYRSQLVLAVTERDELVNVICPQLELKYVLTFGAIEIEISEAQCECKRLKRQIEMMQANINRQEEINLDQISEALDQEFVEFIEKINEKIEKEKAAKENVQDEPLEDPQPFVNEKLKKLYRQLAKKLHPDIHPNQKKEDKELFNKVVDAYKKNDLKQMEILNQMASGEEAELCEESIESLRAEADRLQDLLFEVSEEIKTIKSIYPYTAKEVLEDKEAIAIEMERLQNLLTDYQNKIKIYEAKIQAMEEKKWTN